MTGAYKPGRLNAAPEALPLFPLTGALLLPGGQLPLNIFEPRYLAMVDAALAGDRMIGMIQPMEDMSLPRTRRYGAGCAGRITSFAAVSRRRRARERCALSSRPARLGGYRRRRRRRQSGC